MRDITIGQYYPVDSVIHRLDPRTKLMCTFLFIVALFIVKEPAYYAGFLAITLLLYKTANVPMRYFFKGLRAVVILLVFTFFFRMIATPGDVIWSAWILEVTREGVYKAVRLTSRIALMIAGASLLSYTSTPKSLADGLEKSFMFLEKIHVPVRDMAVMTMIAFRFIPLMLEEANSIMDAQAARGMEFEGVSLWRKCRNMFGVAFPLFMNSIRRSADLAMAMEARGFSSDGSTTKMYPLEYGRSDRIAYILAAVMVLAAAAGSYLPVFLR